MVPARKELIAMLRERQAWDIIVIGGGATGLGTAVDAATRGYRTLLLEAHDFAKGTSSRSTKLVHGGVRYLAQGNIGLVREALRERGLLLQNAPHLVHRLGFVVPAYAWWALPFYGAGLKAYQVLSGGLSAGPTTLLSPKKAVELLPTLEQKELKGGVLYYDAQFDDSRLAVTLVRTLFDQGGVALNYLPVTGLRKQNGQICGVVAQDAETGEGFELESKAVVNATGVFVDAVRRLDEPSAKSMLAPSQGAHLVVDRRFLPSAHGLMIPKTDDGRVLFAVPWHDKVILGTTDKEVPEVSLEPRARGWEIEFILSTAGRYLDPKPAVDDVKSVYAGLRPLVKAGRAGSTAALSRDHTIRVSKSGLITVTGGKWTTYRCMGEQVVDRAVAVAGLGYAASRSAGLKLHGYSADPLDEPWCVYGSEAEKVRALPGAHVLLHPQLPYTESQVRFAARYELARTVEDVLARRTRALFLDAKASLEAAPKVAQLLAEELGYPASHQQALLEQYRNVATTYTLKHTYDNSA